VSNKRVTLVAVAEFTMNYQSSENKDFFCAFHDPQTLPNVGNVLCLIMYGARGLGSIIQRSKPVLLPFHTHFHKSIKEFRHACTARVTKAFKAQATFHVEATRVTQSHVPCSRYTSRVTPILEQ
jgi:hypothetical protein